MGEKKPQTNCFCIVTLPFKQRFANNLEHFSRALSQNFLLKFQTEVYPQQQFSYCMKLKKHLMQHLTNEQEFADHDQHLLVKYPASKKYPRPGSAGEVRTARRCSSCTIFNVKKLWGFVCKCVCTELFSLLLFLSPYPSHPLTHILQTDTPFFPRKPLCICGPVSNGPALTESRRCCIEKRENLFKGSCKFAWFLNGFDSLQHHSCY